MYEYILYTVLMHLGTFHLITSTDRDHVITPIIPFLVMEMDFIDCN
jgi:hypothetical protein